MVQLRTAFVADNTRGIIETVIIKGGQGFNVYTLFDERFLREPGARFGYIL